MDDTVETVLKRVAVGELSQEQGRELIDQIQRMRPTPPPPAKKVRRSTVGMVASMIFACLSGFYLFASLGLMATLGFGPTIFSAACLALCIWSIAYCAKLVPAQNG